MPKLTTEEFEKKYPKITPHKLNTSCWIDSFFAPAVVSAINSVKTDCEYMETFSFIRWLLAVQMAKE